MIKQEFWRWLTKPAILSEHCSNCRFWAPVEDTIGPHDCRRRAPTFVNKRGWPLTTHDAWCGDWKRKK